MSEELKKAILELRERVEGAEKHSGKWPDPWTVDLEKVIQKTIVPKKK